MGLTYTPAERRDRLQHQRSGGLNAARLLLPATSCVALLALALTYSGRVRSVAMEDAPRSGVQVVNLNTVGDATAFDPVLGTVFPAAADRALAARELFRFVVDRRREADLPNVGAIARVTVAIDTIDKTEQLDVFAERARALRDRANGDKSTNPGTVALLTAADLAALKPFFVVRTRAAFRNDVLLFGLLYVLAFHAVAVVWRVRAVGTDHLLLAVTHLLTAIGFAVLVSRPDPLRDSLLFVRYAEATLLGLGVMTAVSLTDFRKAAFVEFSYIPLAAGLVLSSLLITFGSGPGVSTAKVNLGPVQPIEAIRLLLAFFLAGYFARRWELLRQLRGTGVRDVRLPQWIDWPRAEYVLPVLGGVALALLFFFVQKDLGPALFLCCVFLATYAVARGRAGMALTGFALLLLGFYAGYRLQISSALADRVRMWQSPWDNAVAGGNQVTHAIWALASGGTFGTGLGLGETRYLPAGHTDLALAAVAEELGAIGLLLVAAGFAILTWRGFRVARLAATDYGFFLATALTLFLVVPVLIMASGVLGVTPLTGVVTPFLSYGGSAMVANFAAVGMLMSIHADARPAGDFAPFRLPVRYLGGVLGAFAVALIAIALNVQLLHADEYLVKPHLGVQADGGRRFEYNPRLLEAIREIPRGSVFDRRGVPLATDDGRVLEAARVPYERLGVAAREACPKAGERCYPFGGRTFHVLGDARTRVNWTAANTSYVERDAEDRLRGFDDHASPVETRDALGRPMFTIRRDYNDVIEVFRHRHEPDHPAMVAARTKPHDVHLTLDVNLQLRVDAILRAYAQKGGGKAAAVVLDPDTGDLLALATYPWPEPQFPSADALIDRARYGLYPPGSTFKLITAAAALRADPNFANASFTCVQLPDGRVGAKIPGWTRPVRDDVLDTHPHGTIRMHDGMVHSCNAYFAQLGVRVGSDALVDTAARLGISLTSAKNTRLRVRDTLPQASYGQADVVATPLRMARVAAAVAADGVLREPRLETSAAVSPARDRLLDPTAARLLASYMRDVVLTGTGRSLRAHPGRIAGKTGTAELADKPSHGWFVGYAPYGPATKRIAFAIIIENAGYGALSAAPAAGEIVSAAMAAGLVK